MLRNRSGMIPGQSIPELGRPPRVLMRLRQLQPRSRRCRLAFWEAGHIAITPSNAKQLTDDRSVFRAASRWTVFPVPVSMRAGLRPVVNAAHEQFRLTCCGWSNRLSGIDSQYCPRGHADHVIEWCFFAAVERCLLRVKTD